MENLLEGFADLELYQGTADKGLFTVDQEAENLSTVESKCFRTVIAKLLYLSKRARPISLPR